MKEFDVLRLYDIQTEDELYIRKADINYVIALSEEHQKSNFPKYQTPICIVKLSHPFVSFDEEKDYVYCFKENISKFMIN